MTIKPFAVLTIALALAGATPARPATAEDTTGPAPAGTPVAPRRIVLDPGHGGPDRGAVGQAGVVEKDAVLALSQAVADRLGRDGHEVRLTRADDRSLGAEQRAAVANFWQAHLFLGVHASGAARPQARGFEVFVAPSPAPGTDPASWRGGQLGREAESRRWAQALGSALGQAAATFDRGVAELPNPVLEAVAAPACLLEAGNLSWPQEADWILTPAGRAQVAEAVARAVAEYFR